MAVYTNRSNEEIVAAMRARVGEIIRAEIPEPDSNLSSMIRDFVEHLDAQPIDDRRTQNVARALAADPALLERVSTTLGAGREYGFIAEGTSALALSFRDDDGELRVLRITNAIEPEIAGGKYVLSPIREDRVDDIRLQVNEPIVDFNQFSSRAYNAVSISEARQLETDFDALLVRDDGLYLHDAHDGNYAMTEDGRLVTHDYGAVRNIEAQRAALGAMTNAEEQARKTKRFDQTIARASEIQGDFDQPIKSSHGLTGNFVMPDAPAPLHATVAEPSHPSRTAAPAPANSTPAPHAPVATNAGDVHPTHTAAAVGAAAAFGAGAGETVGHGGHGGDAHARSVHGVSTGVGAALGVYGMSQKVGRDGTLQSDLKAGGAQAGLAVVSTAGDATAIAADSVGLLRGNGAVGAVARRAALPVAVVAGALETGTAIAARDGHRAANAAGATAGGILGGMAAGAATGLVLGSVVPGAGNVVGAVVGGAAGLVGGLVGAYYGGQAADAVAGAALDNRLNADIDNPLNAMAGKLQRAGYTKMLDKDGDGKIEAHEVRQFVGADGVRDLRAAAKNGLTGAEVSNEIKQQLTENYSHEIKNLIEEAKQKGFTKRLDANQDGKFDITDIKENLKKTGMTLDANTDGHITGGEFIRAQTTPAKPAQAAGAGHGHR